MGQPDLSQDKITHYQNLCFCRDIGDVEETRRTETT